MRQIRTGPFYASSERSRMPRFPSVRGLAHIIVVAIPLAAAVLMARRAVNVPYWDEWEWADLVYKMHVGTLQFADLWMQHGEHRIIVSNLIMLVLARFGGWDPVREQWVSMGMLVLAQLAILAMIRRSMSGTVRSVASVAASLMLFGLWQWDNFDWGFQMGWFICNACAVAAAMLLAQPGRRNVHVLLAVCLAVIGSFTLSQGLIIWVLGVAAIALTGRRRGVTLALWVPAGIVTYYIYAHGMFKLEGGHVDPLGNPLASASYVLTYLGSPLGGWLGVRGSEIAGAALVIALGAAFIADMRSPHQARRFARSAQWYALAVFSVVTAVATCFGRAGYGLDQALASRYTSVSTLAWVALIGLIGTSVSRVRWTLPGRGLEPLLIAAAAFGFVIGASDVSALTQWKVTSDEHRALRAGLMQSDPSALPHLYPDRARIIMLIGEMRTVHDGIFAGQ